jgi:hypothetical protein
VSRKKKSDIEIIINILEDGNLSSRDYHWIAQIVSRRIRSRQAAQRDVESFLLRKEAKDASEERETKENDGRGPVKSSSGKKDKDGHVGPAVEKIREEGEKE